MNFSTSSPTLIIIYLFNFSHHNEGEVVYYCGFCLYFSNSDAEYFFFMDICVSSLEKISGSNPLFIF